MIFDNARIHFLKESSENSGFIFKNLINNRPLNKNEADFASNSKTIQGKL